MTQQEFESMKRPDLEASAKAEAIERELMDFAIKVNEAETVFELADIVRESGNREQIEAFENERFRQLKEIDSKAMEGYTLEDGFLSKPGGTPISIENFDTPVADKEAFFVEALKEAVIKAGDTENQEVE